MAPGSDFARIPFIKIRVLTRLSPSVPAEA